MDKRKNPKIDLWYYPLPKALSKEENDALIAEYLNAQSDDEKLRIRNEIVEGNLRFIAYFINMNCHRYVEIAKRKSASEDLMQVGAVALMNAIKNFDPSYSYAFTTYLGRAIFREVREYVCDLHSLKDEESFEGIMSTEEGRDEIEKIEDYIPYEELAGYRYDKDFILNKILPQLNKRNADIFVDYYFNGKSMQDIGKERSLSREGVSQIVEKTKNQVVALYNYGNNFETLVETNFYGPRIKKKYQNNKVLIEKYGTSFLKEYFIYKLSKNQRKVFEYAVLNYKGESTEQMAQKLGYNTKNFISFLGNAYNVLEAYGDKYFEEYKNGEPVTDVRHNFSRDEFIKYVRSVVEKYGGSEFLEKYFMPVLSDKQKKVFYYAVLHYYGQNLAEIAKICDCTFAYIRPAVKSIVSKLCNTNLTALVKKIDENIPLNVNYNRKRETLNEVIATRAKIDEIGKDFIERYFLPSLTPLQRRFFEDMYINRIYSSYAEFAKAIGKKNGNVATLKREVLIKFNTINKEELVRKQKAVEARKKKLSLEMQHKTSSKAYANLRLKYLNEYGGVDFLMENFYPKLPKNLQIFFENYLVKGCSRRELLEIFKSNNLNFVESTFQLVKLKLQEFKLSFSDFKGAVKDFYSQSPRIEERI